MRLIDADALQNILLPITTALEHEYGSLGGAVSGCMKHIDNAPTVDAVPVVRKPVVGYDGYYEVDQLEECLVLIGSYLLTITAENTKSLLPESK